MKLVHERTYSTGNNSNKQKPCLCKGKCKGQCGCVRNGRKCTHRCGCKGECWNIEHVDENTIEENVEESQNVEETQTEEIAKKQTTENETTNMDTMKKEISDALENEEDNDIVIMATPSSPSSGTSSESSTDSRHSAEKQHDSAE